MSWTDESGNPECECGHLWSNHYHRHNWYGCEAPDCECIEFEEQSEWDKAVNIISQLNYQEEEEEKSISYDCVQHGKGWIKDCPTCQMSEEELKERYIL